MRLVGVVNQEQLLKYVLYKVLISICMNFDNTK